jgi:hypothetical protein
MLMLAVVYKLCGVSCKSAGRTGGTNKGLNADVQVAVTRVVTSVQIATGHFLDLKLKSLPAAMATVKLQELLMFDAGVLQRAMSNLKESDDMVRLDELLSGSNSEHKSMQSVTSIHEYLTALQVV